GDLLTLEADLVRGQHRLGVAAQSRHPGQVVLSHEFARHHGDHTGHRARGRGVDRAYARVRVWAAQDGHVQHPRQAHVVEVVAPADEEAAVLLALDRLADATVRLDLHAHDSPPDTAAATGASGAAARSACSRAAWRMDLTMFT